MGGVGVDVWWVGLCGGSCVAGVGWFVVSVGQVLALVFLMGVTGDWGVSWMWGWRALGVGGWHVNFLFTVEPLRLLPMVVAGVLEGLCCVFF